MSLLTVVVMYGIHRVNMLFGERLNKYMMTKKAGRVNRYGSPVFIDLLKVCVKLGLLDMRCRTWCGPLLVAGKTYHWGWK